MPYFSFGFIYAFVAIVLDGSVTYLGEYIKAVLIRSTDGLPMESALWFLPAMFWASVIYLFIDKTISNEKLKTIIIVLLTSIGCLWTMYGLPNLPWAVSSALSALGFYHLGNIYKRYEKIINDKKLYKKIFLILMAFIGIIGALINDKLNMRVGYWGVVPVTYFNAIVLVWVSLQVAKELGKVKFCKNILSFIGVNSIVYLCVNHPVITLSDIVVKKILKYTLKDCFIVEEILCFFITMIVIYIITKVLMKTKIRVIFGKNSY